ncbi:MAG TPA: carboxyl transferase domain-containing protein [Acidimicrobiales bacterium]|jgi:acetyl-CoA carboxylase carboxyl transferase subunit beta|nr:carboxyl transferase domain-containing protein [Acidimicrobiales bacterium]
MNESTGHGERWPDEDLDTSYFGEGHPDGLPVFETKVGTHLRNRRKVNSPSQLSDLQELMKFKASHGRWRIAKDLVGLVRRGHGGESDESYFDKLRRETGRGKSESSTYGLAEVEGHPVVLYAMNWDFFAGSLGVVSGEKFQAAADLAISKKLPFVSVYASSGVRQQENFAGLTQMTRMVEAIRHYKEKVALPHVAVLLGNVWGGVSASAVPNADLILATSGTNFGFAGPNVIEAFEGSAVPLDSQSAEANLLDRNIDVVVSDVGELVWYLGEILSSTNLPDRHHQLTTETLPLIRNVSVADQRRVFTFGPVGIRGPRLDDATDSVPRLPAPARLARASDESDALVEQYQDLMTDANRVDLEFILHYGFSDSVAVYNYVQEVGYKRYPAIVGAFAKIGSQPFVIVGTQPSYQLIGDTVIKRPSNPAPEDFFFMERMLEMGERLGLPALFVTDTLGAKPTLESERRGQSRAIARSILKGIDYSHPVISLVAGALGSGGGLATTPMADHVIMMQKAMAYVAEPRSAASILYKTPDPSRDQIRTTLATMRSTAQDQLDLGLIDEIVPEGDNPFATVELIHAAILRSYVELAQLSEKRLRSRRQERIRGLRAFEIIQE